MHDTRKRPASDINGDEAVQAPDEGHGRAVRILTFTTLFPNAINPHHGVFVENRLRQLLGSGQVSARVVAPVPWFPSRIPLFGRYADMANVPLREERHRILVDHPRYLVVPKVGMHVAPIFLFLSARRHIRKMMDDGFEFDLIDSHYCYPDGVAAVMLGRHFSKPVTITARGTDVNLIADHPIPRRMIRWAGSRADGVISVCEALRTRLSEIGVSGDKVRVMRNGVDLELFRPLPDRVGLRKRLGLNQFILLSVGHLIRRKGHDLVIRALVDLPEARLLIAGGGPEQAALQGLSKRLQVADRVQFLGVVPHGELVDYYNAADVLVLASSREGWANVLLESMACGTPVVASNVWGTPEVVAAPEAGLLMQERNPRALARAVQTLRDRLPDRRDTRAYACQFGWDPTTASQVELFRSIVGNA